MKNSLLLPFLFGALAPSVLAEDVSRENLEKHVRTLASKEFAGRLHAGARKAEAYVQGAFEKAGLKTTIQEFAALGRFKGRNVIGILQAGNEPSVEHVILSAHYDHIGFKDGKLCPGASDNAAGVAALLELARLIKPPLKRDILFVGFDLEEFGFRGSIAYVKNPVRPLKECAAFVTFDILGRDLVDATNGVLFATGLEQSDTLFAAVNGVKKPDGLHLAYVGADTLEIPRLNIPGRSDYVPFRVAKVPYVFFSTGESLDYHQPTDTADRLSFDKLHREAQFLLSSCRAIAEAPRAKFLDKPALRVEEASTVETVLGQILANRQKLGLDDMSFGMGQMFSAQLQQIAKRGKLEVFERQQMVFALQQLQEKLRGMR